ncbi:MAG: hypothetical protein U9R17_15090 [Thermodesulfobacteriota bacterium]|nr:hypothetical protein [Thermodesulfobacteriota bacterium]
MAKFKINVQVELIECDDATNEEPILNNNGSFSMTISENDAISIDKVENSVLQTSYPAIRKAVEQHLTELSKKKAFERCDKKGQIVTINPHLYQVDGEIGRFSFETHNVSQDDRIQFDTGRDIFPGLKSREIYKTAGFKEMAMIYGDTELSFRKTAKYINHFRYQEKGGTPSRTLHECTETEGRKIQNHIEEKTAKILTSNGFSEDGECHIEPQYANNLPETIQSEQIKAAVEKCRHDNNIAYNLLDNPVPYENPENTTNVAIDDVIVKKQEEKREGPKKATRGKRKYVHNTIAHVSKEGEGSYVLNGHGIKTVLLFCTAFLFSNGLIGSRLQFFTDGHRTLNEIILKCFSWYKNIGIILDWYHLVKKCKELLSMASKGRVIRNEILDKLKPLLWYGSTDMAIEYLLGVTENSIKNKAALEKLIGYLKRNKPYIPCYAVRKELGLCNSSAIGEKMNDLVVSERQKHNGMSWSKTGSVSLATITTLKRNNESDKWFEEKELDFALAA